MAIALLVIAYFIPSIIALMRSHNSAGAIIALNIILGWTFLGWIAALIWSFTGNVKNNSIIINTVISTKSDKKGE